MSYKPAPPWVKSAKVFWTEDDATLKDPSAEHLGAAFLRITGRPYDRTEKPIAEWDGGDELWKLYSDGYAVGQSPSGHEIRWSRPDIVFRDRGVVCEVCERCRTFNASRVCNWCEKAVVSKENPFDKCPCCHGDIEGGDDVDRVLIAAFLGGVIARELNRPPGEVLCGKHARLCAEAMAFTVGLAKEGAH